MNIAQSVERWIVAPEAAGSSPSIHPHLNLTNRMTYSTLHELLHMSPEELQASGSNVKLLLETQNSMSETVSDTTANVRNLTQYTIPDGKLFYPEPFIASPSYLHSDLTYLHIFQY